MAEKKLNEEIYIYFCTANIRILFLKTKFSQKFYKYK